MVSDSPVPMVIAVEAVGQVVHHREYGRVSRKVGRRPKVRSNRMDRLIREARFYEMFNVMAGILIEGARLLSDILHDYRHVAEQVLRLKAIEHRGDDVTHDIYTLLDRTFITPFDPEDIHGLAASIDDVLDCVDAASQRLVMYKIQNPPAAARELALIIVRQTEELAQAIIAMASNREILRNCVEIHRLENEADQIACEAVAKLFENATDAITLIKHKELLEMLERATDKAEDAANAVESIVVKNA